MNLFSKCVAFSALVCGAYSLSDKATSDKVTNLPNQPDNVDFDQYAGYITIDQANNKSLFYWFQESSAGASSSPIVLWVMFYVLCSI